MCVCVCVYVCVCVCVCTIDTDGEDQHVSVIAHGLAYEMNSREEATDTRITS